MFSDDDTQMPDFEQVIKKAQTIPDVIRICFMLTPMCELRRTMGEYIERILIRHVGDIIQDFPEATDALQELLKRLRGD